MSSFTLIGIMSGTSMDGLDIANACFLNTPSGEWEFVVNQTQTVKYSEPLLQKLKSSFGYSPVELLKLDKELGGFIAEKINLFIDQNAIDRSSIDAIASHGHTIFHQPENGFTYQIGCGETIALNTGIKVINDFRQKDVSAGGQGAPLVPIGDKFLFGKKAEAFLNIGGFANICFPGTITYAYDICPGNLPMNKIAEQLGFEYDSGGKLASSGSINNEVLDQLNALNYYNLSPPKSLGVEWLHDHFYPLIESINEPKDQLKTIVEHIAIQISNELHKSGKKSVMITGGGVKNNYLMNRISSLYSGEVNIPSEQIVDFKEAIIFAFLGALYLSNTPNTLSSVTGAKKDTIGGVLHLP